MHAHAVRHAAMEMGRRIHILDSRTYLSAFDLSASFGTGADGSIVRLQTGETIDLADVAGLWWRRPSPPAPTDGRGHPGLTSTIEAEASHALFGSLNATVANAFNRSSFSRRAAYKPLQLATARQFGLTVPATLITSDPQAGRRFFDDAGGHVVYKLFDGTDIGFFETRRLAAADLGELWRLAICPVILQYYVEGDFDLRVTIVGDQLFAARLDYDREAEIIDTRFTMKPAQSFELPADLAGKLIALTRHFGLTYAAIDLRFSERNGFTFFELNPEGQYLWTEIEAGLAISKALAREILGVAG